MVSGRELQRETFSPAGEGSALLLNPRLPANLRRRVLESSFPELEAHVWVATSGTSGRLKMVALSRSALEASARAVNRHLGANAQDIWINPLPLFHVGGLGIAVRAGLTGGGWHLFETWNPAEFVRRADESGATLSALVPAQVHDLVGAGLNAPSGLRAVVVGGGVLDAGLRLKAAALGWPLLPSYGLTEAASQAATARVGAKDAEWLPLLDHVEARSGEGGVLELRGPSLLTGWMIFEEDGRTRWEDPKREGWYRTSDRVELRGRELRVLGRLDDLVKIRGELVDVAALQRALQARVRSGLVRLDAQPDKRNGVRLVVVAENAPAESEARGATDLFPPYAKPDNFRIGPIPVSPLGKKLRFTR